MNIGFSLKLFIAFLVFGLILFFSSFYLSYSVFNKKFYSEEMNSFFKLVEESEKNLNKSINHQKDLLKEIYKSEEFKNMYVDLLIDKLSTILISSTDLSEISIIKNITGKEIIRVIKDNKKVQESIYYDTINNFEIFSELIKLEKGNIYNSEIKLNKVDGEIKTPLEPIIYFAIKDDQYTIVLKVDVNWVLKSLSFADYIIDSDTNIIFDKSRKYYWTNYFYPEIKLENSIKNITKYISNASSISNNYYFKKILIGDKNKYINVILKNKNISFTDFIKKYKESIYAIAYISFIVAFILALVFTTPLSNINKKLASEKDLLNDSIQKNRLVLSDSLEVIDQYVMYLKMDKYWNIIDASNNFCKTSGFQKEEIIGHKYETIVHSSSQKNFKDAIVFLRTSKVWSGELLNIKKTGVKYWISSHIEANYNQKNELVSYTEIRTDIDDKKRIESLYNDLNYQIEQLNVIFQNAHSGIALIDKEGNFKKFNKAFINILQYNKDEILEKNFFKLADDSSRNLLNEVSNELEELESISNVELIFLTKNSEEIYLDVSFRILPEKENILIVTNSLEDKRKLQELNQNLEQKVFEEVQKNIEKDKIHQEQQIKNAKLTSIGTLAAGITHEINTPLTYLKGNFELLMMDLEDLPESKTKKDMLEGCEKIEEAINRIAVIVESMREMSQSSSVAKEKSNIYATLITSLTMAYNVSKQISKIYLNGDLFTITDINKNKFQIFADIQKQRIEQVWIIIINNALDELKNIEDYEKREFNILVYEHKDEVIVKFKDNAGGIKEDIIDKIFDPFISTKQHSGMGVGLNIAKKIIDEQEGIILAYNKDSGAIFEVRLKKSL